LIKTGLVESEVDEAVDYHPWGGGSGDDLREISGPCKESAISVKEVFKGSRMTRNNSLLDHEQIPMSGPLSI
jgi:hypothetical protein